MIQIPGWFNSFALRSPLLFRYWYLCFVLESVSFVSTARTCTGGRPMGQNSRRLGPGKSKEGTWMAHEADMHAPRQPWSSSKVKTKHQGNNRTLGCTPLTVVCALALWAGVSTDATLERTDCPYAWMSNACLFSWLKTAGPCCADIWPRSEGGTNSRER